MTVRLAHRANYVFHFVVLRYNFSGETSYLKGLSIHKMQMLANIHHYVGLKPSLRLLQALFLSLSALKKVLSTSRAFFTSSTSALYALYSWHSAWHVACLFIQPLHGTFIFCLYFLIRSCLRSPRSQPRQIQSPVGIFESASDRFYLPCG